MEAFLLEQRSFAYCPTDYAEVLVPGPSDRFEVLRWAGMVDWEPVLEEWRVPSLASEVAYCSSFPFDCPLVQNSYTCFDRRGISCTACSLVAASFLAEQKHQSSSCMERTVVAVDSSIAKALEAATSFRKELARSLWFGGLRNRADVIDLCLNGGHDLPSKTNAAIYWGRPTRPSGVSQVQEFPVELHLCACLDYFVQADYRMVAGVASFTVAVTIAMPSFDLGTAIEPSNSGKAFMELVGLGT